MNSEDWTTRQSTVVRRVDDAIQRINHYPADNYKENVLRYPLDSDFPMNSVIQPLNKRPQRLT